MSAPDDGRLEAELFDLVCMLVSSARGALEEGVFTASLRMIHAAERLGSIAGQLGPAHAPMSHQEFFEQIASTVRSEATSSYLASAQEYQAFLDRTVGSIAMEIRRDNGM